MISLVVAYDENQGIGYKGKMPWHIPEDLRRFQNLTLGQGILMGRKTFESIVHIVGGPLPYRMNYVLSTSQNYDAPNVKTVTSLEEGIEEGRKKNLHLLIGGGVKVYEQALPLCDFLYITKIHATFSADTFFPKWNKEDFTLLFEKKIEGKTPYTFYTYAKKRILL